MTENKLKYMIESNKLDNIINNKSEAEKLCKLETTEEVLDLLKKYNYNETKEVFERELLEILQISLSEEELNKVTGGRISHKQTMATLLGVISLTGAINIPTEAASTKKSVSAVTKEKIEKKQGKNSTWMAAPKEDKFAKALTGIVGVGGVGSLLFYGGYKQLRKNTQKNIFNENPKDLDIMPPSTAPNEQWERELAQINEIAVSLIEKPIQRYDELVAEINREDLMTFALEGLKRWCENTKNYYTQELRSITDADAWNANFGLLMKVRWAIWLLCLKDGKITAKDLQNHVKGRTYAMEYHLEKFNYSPVWTERYIIGTTRTLPKTVDIMNPLWPSDTDSIGNIKLAYWSINAALLEEGDMKDYKEFNLEVGNTLKAYLPYWWTEIP